MESFIVCQELGLKDEKTCSLTSKVSESRGEEACAAMTIPGPPRRDATSLCGGYTHLAARLLMGNTTSVASIGCGRARQKSFFFFP